MSHRLAPLAFFEGAVRALGRGEQQFRQIFAAQGGVNEKGDDHRDRDAEHVKKAAQALPAAAARVIENWIGHETATFNLKMQRVQGQRAVTRVPSTELKESRIRSHYS